MLNHNLKTYRLAIVGSLLFAVFGVFVYFSLQMIKNNAQSGPGGSRSDFRTQLIKMTVTSGLSLVTASAPADFTPVDPNKTIVLISGITQHSLGRQKEVKQNPNDISIRAELTGANTIKIYREATPSFESTVWLLLVEYTGDDGGPNEFIVRDRRSQDWISGETLLTYGPISSVVDISDVVVFNEGVSNTNTSRTNYDRGDVNSFLDGNGNVRLKRGDGAGIIHSVHQVVEFTGSNWTIQTGETVPAPNPGGTNVTVNDVGNIQNVWVYFTWDTDSPNLDERGHRVFLTSTTNLVVQEHKKATGNKNVRWYLIQNPQINVQTQAADKQFKHDLQAQITGFTPVAALERSFVWISGMTDDGGNKHPRDMWQFELQDAATINLLRGYSGKKLDYRYYVVELPVGDHPQFNQTHFHWRNDDGNESTATSATGGTEDVGLVGAVKGQNYRLRLEVANQGTLNSPSLTFNLEYALKNSSCVNATGWTEISGSGDWVLAESTAYVDGDNSSNIAISSGGVSDSNPVFKTTNGSLKDSVSSIGPIVLNSNEFLEVEYSVKATVSAADGANYCFRITNQGTPLDNYVKYAEVSLEAVLAPVAEFGQLTLIGNTPQTVNLNNSYQNLVVVASPRYAPTADVQRSTRIITKTTGINSNFQIKVGNEASSLTTETTVVDWIAMESGEHQLYGSGGNLKVYADSVNVSGVFCKGNVVVGSGTVINYPSSFVGVPVFLHTVASNTDIAWVGSVVDDGSSYGNEPTSSQARLFLNRSYGTCSHGAEQIDYIAWEQGHYNVDGAETDVSSVINGVSCCSSGGDGVDFAQPFAQAPLTVIVGQMGINGQDGGFAVSHTGTATTTTTHYTSIDEDGPGADRVHTAETVGIVSFEPSSGQLSVPVSLMQSGYRFFNNSNSYDAGSALTSQDSVISLTSQGQVFRLRSLIHVNTSILPLNASSFKLQYSVKNGICDIDFLGENYVDVTNNTPVAYFDNSVAVDGNVLVLNIADPVHSGHSLTAESYNDADEGLTNFFSNNQSVISPGSDGLWDFALKDNQLSSKNSYCLRVVNSNGDLLNAYLSIPQVTFFNASPASSFNASHTFQNTDGSKSVQMELTFSDAEFDNLRAKFEYSLYNGSSCSSTWNKTNLLGPVSASVLPAPDINNSASGGYRLGSGIPVLTTSANTISFDWDVGNDVPNQEALYCLRSMANDLNSDQVTPDVIIINIDTKNPSAPSLDSPIIAGDTQISGLSSEIDGTTIKIYVGNSEAGTTTVIGGAWLVATLPANLLQQGEGVKAVAFDSFGNAGNDSSIIFVDHRVSPVPLLQSPIIAGDVLINGTVIAPDQSNIEVFVNGVSVGTTIVSSNTWQLVVNGSELQENESVVAYSSIDTNNDGVIDSNDVQSLPSGSLLVVPRVSPAPQLNSGVLAGDVLISGLSNTPNGTKIDVYVQGVGIGNTAVTANTWQLSGISSGELQSGEQVTAVATVDTNNDGVIDGLDNSSVFSTPVTVIDRVSSVPAVNTPLPAASTNILGTCNTINGSLVEVFVGGVLVGTTNVSSGNWNLVVSSSELQTGENVNARSLSDTNNDGLLDGNDIYSFLSAQIIVDVTVDVSDAPTINQPIIAGDLVITGTSVDINGTVIDVLVNNVSIGTTLVTAHTWSLSVAASELQSAEQVVATATIDTNNDGFINGTDVTGPPSSVVMVISKTSPVPSVNSPVVAGNLDIGGLCNGPDGSKVNVYVDTVSLGAVDVVSGAWDLVGLSASELQAGESLTSICSIDTNNDGVVNILDLPSSISSPVVVGHRLTGIPTINSPVIAADISISGIATSLDGDIIQIQDDTVDLGNTGMTNNSWDLTGISPSELQQGEKIRARIMADTNNDGIIDSNDLAGNWSAEITVGHLPPALAPVLNSPVTAGDIQIAGTSADADGTEVVVYIDNVFYGGDVVSGGLWNLTSIPPNELQTGESITSFALLDTTNDGIIDNNDLSSPSSIPVIVDSLPPASAPVINGGLKEGDVLITGSSDSYDGTVIKVYVDNLSVGQAIVVSHLWSLTVVFDELNSDEEVTAGAWIDTNNDGVIDINDIESDLSDVVSVASPGGLSAPVFIRKVVPQNISVEINNNKECTFSREVNVRLNADNAQLFKISDNPFFPGAVWQVFPSSSLLYDFTLQGGTEDKNIYVLFRSPFGYEAGVVFDTIKLDLIDYCQKPMPAYVPPEVFAPPVVDNTDTGVNKEPSIPAEQPLKQVDNGGEFLKPQEKPSKEQGGSPLEESKVTNVFPSVSDDSACCNPITYDLFIINPDGSERHVGSRYVSVSKIATGKFLYSFEDKGLDMDMNDLIIEVDSTGCQSWGFRLDKVNASWHHKIMVRFYFREIVLGTTVLWEDSQSYIKKQKNVSFSQIKGLCKEMLPGVVLYEHINYRGRSVIVLGNSRINDLQTGVGLDGVVSSIRVFGGAKVELYNQPYLHGKAEYFIASDADLRDNKLKNDTVSSLRVLE